MCIQRWTLLQRLKKHMHHTSATCSNYVSTYVPRQSPTTQLPVTRYRTITGSLPISGFKIKHSNIRIHNYIYVVTPCVSIVWTIWFGWKYVMDRTNGFQIVMIKWYLSESADGVVVKMSTIMFRGLLGSRIENKHNQCCRKQVQPQSLNLNMRCKKLWWWMDSWHVYLVVPGFRLVHMFQ